MVATTSHDANRNASACNGVATADDVWTRTQQHAAVGCLQGVISALHGEFKRFVRVCVREHVLKGMPMRNELSSARNGEVDVQVTALLDDKLSAGAEAADFASYLQFADQHWRKYVADLDFHGDLRAVVRRSREVRDRVARQAPMTQRDFDHALAALRRLGELIAVQQTTNDLIEALIDTAAIDVSDTSSHDATVTRTKASSRNRVAVASVWVIVLLCWVIVALLWVIAVLQDDTMSNTATSSWLSRFAVWDLPLRSLTLTHEPVTPEPQSAWALLKAFVPTPTPAPTPVLEPTAASWFSWL